jgi:hypothetical protein
MQLIRTAWIHKDEPPCKCGGSFTKEAVARCPQCGATEFGESRRGSGVYWD